jgi:hypothetical protein
MLDLSKARRLGNKDVHSWYPDRFGSRLLLKTWNMLLRTTEVRQGYRGSLTILLIRKLHFLLSSLLQRHGLL